MIGPKPSLIIASKVKAGAIFVETLTRYPFSLPDSPLKTQGPSMNVFVYKNLVLSQGRSLRE